MKIDTDLFVQIAERIKGGGVNRTPQLGLKRLEFKDNNGQRFVAIEQNPLKSSKWADLARSGKSVVQFKHTLTDTYVAVSVDGVIEIYGSK